MDFSFIDEFADLRSEPMRPQPAEDFVGYDNIFEAVRNHDCLMHHPYESFDPVVNFVSQAATDPSVLAIKQTLYRVSADSPIIKALIKAAENGKQVTVLVELKARFDEENNIIWAKRLEHAGCHVIYGLVGLKIHCKTILVVRREEDQIRRYVHLGTGNYNDSTAKLYTDHGYFTCRDAFGADVSALFNLLTGYAKEPKWKKLAVAPGNLRQFFMRAIDTEIKHAKKGHPARIVAKMNSLVDEDIIEKLYEASNAGVKIKLLVRGMCCLRSGVKGQSEHIEVYSIVGTFLEHSRIYYFHDGGQDRYYLSSADWMPRNLDRRVETLFPIGAEHLKARLEKLFDVTFNDTVKIRIQNPDGSYSRVKPQEDGLESQVHFHKQAKQTAKEKKEALLHIG
jgi:polyphosphate kinase